MKKTIISTLISIIIAVTLITAVQYHKIIQLQKEKEEAELKLHKKEVELIHLIMKVEIIETSIRLLHSELCEVKGVNCEWVDVEK